jgi:hypothetical protein
MIEPVNYFKKGLKYGWEAGLRTPISRVRVCCPTVERPPSKRPNYIGPRIFLSSFKPADDGVWADSKC